MRSTANLRRARGAKAHAAGLGAETFAALWLMMHGWRVLGMRIKTPLGEIDLLARRGGVVAVVEVKRRRTAEEALGAVSLSQRGRLRRAGETLVARRGDLAGCSVRLDLVAIGAGRLPRHIPDAWPQDGRG